MRPLAVLVAIIFGSSAAISFGLVATLIVLSILQGKYPHFSSELPALLRNSALFILLTGVSGASLYALLKSRPWRWATMSAMCLILIGLWLVFWPEPQG